VVSESEKSYVIILSEVFNVKKPKKVKVL